MGFIESLKSTVAKVGKPEGFLVKFLTNSSKSSTFGCKDGDFVSASRTKNGRYRNVRSPKKNHMTSDI